LFGNIKNTIRAKAELLACLPKEGIAIVNGDNDYCHEALEYCRAGKVVEYGISGDRDVKATGVKQNGEILRFKAHIDNESGNFEVSVLGKHYVQNLLAAIYCAFELGLNLEEISQYVKSCKTVEQSLELFEGKKGVRILDDSYNSNPDGFIAALKTAKDLNAKRVILVTMGMLELGKGSDELHRKVAKKIKKICDAVFVTSRDAYKVFKEIIEDVELVEDHKDLINRMDEILRDGDLILFENRVQKSVLDHFKK
jgi:UDP-N-acetylmuramoyl-tripeptide--D-alanyl-D-alanine ligase